MEGVNEALKLTSRTGVGFDSGDELIKSAFIYLWAPMTGLCNYVQGVRKYNHAQNWYTKIYMIVCRANHHWMSLDLPCIHESSNIPNNALQNLRYNESCIALEEPVARPFATIRHVLLHINHHDLCTILTSRIDIQRRWVHA